MALPAAVDLESAITATDAPSVRRLILMVLLLAIKDMSDEIRFDPLQGDDFPDMESAEFSAEPTRKRPQQCRIRYRVEGAVYDMVPAPFPASRIVWELALLTELASGKVTAGDVEQGDPSPFSSGSWSMALKLGPTSVPVSVHAAFNERGASAVLALHVVESCSERVRANDLLRQAIKIWGPETPAPVPGTSWGWPRMQDAWPLVLHMGIMTFLFFCLVLLALSVPMFPFSAMNYLALCCFGLLALAGAWRRRRLWSLMMRARRFLTASDDRVVLRYAPELADKADPKALLDRAARALGELEALFGRLPRPVFRRKVYVYLFSRVEEVQAIFGQGYGGTALLILHAVVVTFGATTLDEHLRHELAHLFTLRWNPLAPPLVSEGLPTWLQKTHEGYPIDFVTGMMLPDEEDYPLRRLLDYGFFFDMSHRGICYAMAGSFTGFLLRRFGWDRYKQLYRRVWRQRRFNTYFATHFGLTFAEAEGEWRQELQQRYGLPGG
jgi:hypothetical protein